MEAATRNKTMPEAVVDPVCGMTFADGNAEQVMAHGGHLNYFCSKECRMTFKKNPARYATTRSSKTKGWFRRFLGRLARANGKKFGGGRVSYLSKNELNYGCYFFLNTWEL